MILLFIHGAMILFVVIMAIIGCKVGVTKRLISMIAVILSIAAMIFIGPKTEQFLLENTEIREQIEEKLYENLMDAKVDFTKFIPNLQLPNFEEEMPEETLEGINLEGLSDLNGLEIPDTESLKEEIKENIREQTENYLLEMKKQVVRSVSYEVSFGIVRLLSHLLTFVISLLLLLLISAILKLTSKLPVIRNVDAFFGMVVSLIEAILILGVLFSLLYVFIETQSESSIPVMYIRNEILIDPIIRFYYEHNLIQMVRSLF